jgi:hypothetical protein
MRFTRFPVALLAVAAMAGACSTDLTGLNKNPNNPTTAPATALFTNATQATVSRFWGSFQTLSMSELFAQHIAQVQYVDEDRGRVRPGTIDALFTNIYSVELEDYQKVIDQGKAANSPNVWGPAATMQSWIFQNATDLWGDIPYSEALKGDAGGSLTPKYDPQKDVYYGLLKTLTDASAAMTAGGTGLAGSDPIYKGDGAKWKKFANSLRARMALRMSKADPAKAATELTAAFAGGVMTSNADNATLVWPGDGVFDNPWSANFATRDDHRLSKTLVDTMLALNDPRLKVYAQPTKADPTKYAGLQNGMDNITVAPFFNTTSRPGAIFYPGATSYGTFGTAAGKKTPSYIMTYAEVEFIAAEAAEKGLGGQSGAAGHYANAVRASILQWGGTDAEATAYLAQPGVAYAGGAAGLAQIGLQKWISMFTQGNEAWSEWRRTGNPASIKPGPKMYWNYVNRRMPYSTAEASVNNTNLQAAITRQGPDDYATRIWWDK